MRKSFFMALVAVIVMSQLASAGLLERLRAASRGADELDGRRHGRRSGQGHSGADDFVAGPRAGPATAEAGRDSGTCYARPGNAGTGNAGTGTGNAGTGTGNAGTGTGNPGCCAAGTEHPGSGPEHAGSNAAS